MKTTTRWIARTACPPGSIRAMNSPPLPHVLARWSRTPSPLAWAQSASIAMAGRKRPGRRPLSIEEGVNVSTLSQHHKELNELGEGCCSVPMWSGGMPSGFCDRPAYGERPFSPERMNYCSGQMQRDDNRYNGYVPGLACSCHGGPNSRVFMDGNAWCAVLPDFINPQESPAGFGNTPEEARANLAKEPA